MKLHTFSIIFVCTCISTYKTLFTVGKKMRERNLSGSDGKPRSSSTSDMLMSSGGLSVTGCLTDFSLYIFHPYGAGGQRKNASAHSSPRLLGKYVTCSIPVTMASTLQILFRLVFFTYITSI